MVKSRSPDGSHSNPARTERGTSPSLSCSLGSRRADRGGGARFGRSRRSRGLPSRRRGHPRARDRRERGEFAEHVGVVSVRHPIANGERITFKVSRPCKRIYGYVLYCGVCNRTSVRRTSALEPPSGGFGIASIGTLSGAVSLPEIAAPVLGVASLLMLGTAATGVCGLYALLGVDTCPVSAVDSR